MINLILACFLPTAGIVVAGDNQDVAHVLYVFAIVNAIIYAGREIKESIEKNYKP